MLILIIVLAGLGYWYFTNKPFDQFNIQSLTLKAKNLYLDKKATGTDFSTGPCISQDIAPDWVVDIAHNPREQIDNEIENQCSTYLEGKAHHFIELDPDGNFLRAQ